MGGFTVGVVEKSRLINGGNIRPGDKLIGLASSGVHSNGYSLVRKVFSVKEQKRFSKMLLEPTRIYVKPVLRLLQRMPLKGIAHITGGSFQEKLGRILPKGRSAVLKKSVWEIPEVFKRIQAQGIAEQEMYATFNMGIGMVLVVSPMQVPQTLEILSRQGIKNWEVGEINKGKREVAIV